MKDLCVFCGKKPDKRNWEHIIPLWLIEQTGSSKRIMRLSYLDENLDLKVKKIPFNSFKIRSCTQCNNEFAIFEKKCKISFNYLLKDESLSSNDFNNIMSFFDKLRVGIRHNYLKISHNPFDVNPNYFILSRLEQKDRILYIYKTNNDNKILSLFGMNTLCFQLSPNSMGLILDNYLIVNISYDFLISKRIGFPYPSDIKLFKSGKALFKIEKGKRKIKYPIIPIKYDNRCTKIYQPLVQQDILKDSYEYYDNPHVKKYMDDFQNGKGKILFCDNKKLLIYPKEKSNKWIPEEIIDFDDRYNIIIQVLKHQNYFNRNSPKLSDKDKEVQMIQKTCYDLALKWNILIIRNLRKNQRTNKT